MIVDIPTETRLKTVYPYAAAQWLMVRDGMWKKHGLQLRVTSGLRSCAEQWAIYALGRKKDHGGVWVVVNKHKVVSNARGGESFHNFGLAIDSAFMGDDPYLSNLPLKETIQLWNAYGALCKEHNLQWGGDWVGNKMDRPHCQMSFGLSLHVLQMLYEADGLEGIFNKCNQIMNCGREIA